MFTLRLMSAATGGAELCTTGSVSVTVTSGAFELPLPAACTDAIRSRSGAPELWQELSVAGAVVGPPTRLGAVPYAVVAERASVAEGALSMQIAALQMQVAALGNDNPDCPRGYTRDAAATPGVVCARVVLGQRDEGVKVGTGASAFWIDRDEAAVHHGTSGAQLGAANTSGGGEDNVPARTPRNGQRSGATPELVALSHAGMPSVLVTWFQSNEACRGAGKQLPSGNEWLAAASGTLDNSTCNVSSGAARAATPGNACRSAWGAHDMIGNVWEWTAEWYAGAGQATSPTPGFGPQGAQNWGADYNGDGTWNVDGYVFHLRIELAGPLGGGLVLPAHVVEQEVLVLVGAPPELPLRRSEPLHVQQLSALGKLPQAPLSARRSARTTCESNQRSDRASPASRSGTAAMSAALRVAA